MAISVKDAQEVRLIEKFLFTDDFGEEISTPEEEDPKEPEDDKWE